MAMSLSFPSLFISRRGADRIRGGHVWVYRSDVVEAEGVQPGAVVLVKEKIESSAGKSPDKSATRSKVPRTLGTALYSTASEIAIRMISQKSVDDVEQLV